MSFQKKKKKKHVDFYVFPLSENVYLEGICIKIIIKIMQQEKLMF